MADLERGQRIKARREELHLTQPAVVELIETAAKALPAEDDLNPAKAGKAPVSLRGYQTYEKGGGIIWGKAKLLAGVLQMDVQAMMHGPAEGDVQETPSPFADRDLDARLDQIEQAIADARAERDEQARVVAELLETQNALLARQSAILERIEAATARVDAASRGLADSAAQAGQVLRSGTRRQTAKATKPASKRSPRASNPARP